MFPYADPTGSGHLEATGALARYREELDAWYRQLAGLENSAFTRLEAYEELPPGVEAEPHSVSWLAFPRTAPATPQQIDADRLRFQDEYVEWRVERGADGRLERVTFTTEFTEYFEALAAQGVEAIREEIGNLNPGAAVTADELFGAGTSPGLLSPLSRAQRFRRFLPENPWNNGKLGILCLTQRFNTLGALFNLLGQCGIEKLHLPPGEVCSNVGGFCGALRASDPKVCSAAQTLVRAGLTLSPRDPAGIRILSLEGIWKIQGQTVDINDETNNRGAWKVFRNGRRAVLDLTGGVTIGDGPVSSGAQVAGKLLVGSEVVSAPNDLLPEWARTGKESLRGA